MRAGSCILGGAAQYPARLPFSRPPAAGLAGLSPWTQKQATFAAGAFALGKMANYPTSREIVNQAGLC